VHSRNAWAIPRRRAAGLRVQRVKDNPQYKFVSNNAQGATRKFGVKSISLIAVK
jgi:hypothetical protein